MRKSGLNFIGILICLLVVVILFTYKEPFTVCATETAVSGMVGEVFIEPGTTGKPIVMELGSKNCIPCKMMTPVLEELAAEYSGKIDVIFIDVRKQEDIAQRYKIYAIPTQIFFNSDGKEVFRHEGFFPKEAIIDKLNEMKI